MESTSGIDVDRLLAASVPGRREAFGRLLPLLVFIAALASLPLMAMLSETAQTFVAIPGVIFSIAFIIIWRRRSRRGGFVARQVAEIEGHGMRDNWTAVRDGTIAMLSRPVMSPGLRLYLIYLLASAVDRLKDYRTADRLYEHVTQNSSHVTSLNAMSWLGLAIVKLHDQQLTDAISILGRLERASLPPNLQAMLTLTQLYQEVLMGQNETAAESADARRKVFREHLSTKAGFGYALLACACDRQGESQRAQSLWHDATLLMHPSRILERYPFLSDVNGRYIATECPL